MRIDGHKVDFMAEQVGFTENNFKKKLSILFKQQQKNLRAYLSQVKYSNTNSIHVALCIHAEAGTETLLMNVVDSVFTNMFNVDEHLDVIFLSKSQELMLRKKCCPFYSTPSYRYHKPDFYLISHEDHRLAKIRDCYKLKRLFNTHHGDYMLCEVEPHR